VPAGPKSGENTKICCDKVAPAKREHADTSTHALDLLGTAMPFFCSWRPEKLSLPKIRVFVPECKEFHSTMQIKEEAVKVNHRMEMVLNNVVMIKGKPALWI
jgi:hypothetical protein